MKRNERDAENSNRNKKGLSMGWSAIDRYTITSWDRSILEELELLLKSKVLLGMAYQQVESLRKKIIEFFCLHLVQIADRRLFN